jgi:hypothetical protein
MSQRLGGDHPLLRAGIVIIHQSGVVASSREDLDLGRRVADGAPARAAGIR